MTTLVADKARPNEKPGRHRSLARADAFLTGWRMLLLAAALYLVYALVITWPLARSLSGQISAPNFTEDGAGSDAYFAYVVAHHIFPFAPAHMSALNAPSGYDQQWALNLAQAPMGLPWWLLSLAFGAVAGGNIFMLLGFVASGVSMFALTRRLFGSRSAALLAGFAFAFYPFPVAAASVHYEFVHGWPMVLCFWALIEMVQRPSHRTALLAGLATAFAMWWNPYYELFAGVAFAALAAVAIAVGVTRARLRASLIAIGVALLPIAALGVFFLVLLEVAGGLAGVGTIDRPLLQVYGFSAHMRDYLLPSPNNLLFGHLTGPYLNHRLGYSNPWETAIYPGYVVVALATMGFLRACRQVRITRAALSDIRVIAVLAAAVLALAAVICSAPPTVTLGGVTITMPSEILYRITPTWRTFARFVIPLELGLCIMMAAELARLRARLRGRAVGIVMVAIGVLLALDLWARPPHTTVSTAPPAAYSWLQAHPGGMVADYPLLPGLDPATARALFWQAYDGHPLLDGYLPETAVESEKLDLADLSNPQTAGRLAAYGVRYIVVHADTPGGSPAQLRARGYRLIVPARGSSLWLVTARPARTSVNATTGFDWASGFPTYDRRLLQGRGSLSVSARHCPDCSAKVSFYVDGVGRATRLLVRDARTGAILARIAVPRPHRTVWVSVLGIGLVRGHARLELQTTPRGSDVKLGLSRARVTLQRS